MVFVVFVRIKVNKKNRNCVTFVILKIERIDNTVQISDEMEESKNYSLK